jgi:hypothetical protein
MTGRCDLRVWEEVKQEGKVGTASQQRLAVDAANAPRVTMCVNLSIDYGDFTGNSTKEKPAIVTATLTISPF